MASCDPFSTFTLDLLEDHIVYGSWEVFTTSQKKAEFWTQLWTLRRETAGQNARRTTWGILQAWVQIPALPFSRCLVYLKPLSLSFLTYKIRHNNMYFQGLLWRPQDSINVMWPKHSRHSINAISFSLSFPTYHLNDVEWDCLWKTPLNDMLVIGQLTLSFWEPQNNLLW